MRRTVLLLSSMALAMLLVSTVALAAFPGSNGKIAFVLWDGNDSEIYTANPDGSGESRLTNNMAIDSTPAWPPTAGG